MKKITFAKKAMAFLLAIALIVSGISFPKSNAEVAEAAEETEAQIISEPCSA